MPNLREEVPCSACPKIAAWADPTNYLALASLLMRVYWVISLPGQSLERRDQGQQPVSIVVSADKTAKLVFHRRLSQKGLHKAASILIKALALTS